MKRTLRLVLTAVLALAFAGSIGMLLYRDRDYKEAEASYAEAETLAELPDLSALPAPAPEAPADVPEAEEGEAAPPKPVYVDPYADALRNMDFTALREVNGDVLGWILIPGTAVSYPLVQGTDNQYYLTHTWKKWTSAVGAIFLEYLSSPDLSDFNTVVYGHRMNNGSMFASLKNYKSQSYWAAHPCVYITDDSGSHKYEIFAAYEAATDEDTYQIGFSGDASKQAFLDACMGRSVISTGVVPTVNDRVLTLSTCTGRGHATRWVVQAVLRGVAASDAVPEEAAVPEEPAVSEEAAVSPEKSAAPEEAAVSPEEAGTEDLPGDGGEEALPGTEADGAGEPSPDAPETPPPA